MSRWPSVAILQAHCERWFRERRAAKAFFPGRYCSRGELSNVGPVLDIVLFGDFAEQILQSHSWPPARSYRIWTLSTAARDVLVKVFRFSEDQIGVIPRYELFPMKAKP